MEKFIETGAFISGFILAAYFMNPWFLLIPGIIIVEHIYKAIKRRIKGPKPQKKDLNFLEYLGIIHIISKKEDKDDK